MATTCGAASALEGLQRLREPGDAPRPYVITGCARPTSPRPSTPSWRRCRRTTRTAGERLGAGDDWQDTGLVLTTCHGAALDAGNVRKMFKRQHRGRDQARLDPPRAADVVRQPDESPGGQHRGNPRPVGPATTRTTEIVYPPRTTAGHHHRRRDHGPALHRNLTPARYHSGRGPVRASRGPLANSPGSTGDGHPADPAGHHVPPPPPPTSGL